MFRNILVPLDGTRVSETALPYARALATRSGGRLILMRAAQPPAFVEDSAVEQLRVVAQAEDYLAALADDLTAAGFAVQTAVPLAGSASAWIVEEVGIRQADLIVMGTHERSGLDRWIHGSIAESVVSRAGIPVMLIRATEDAPAPDGFDGPHPRVVVPLDGSSLAAEAIPLARELASTLGAQLVLVTVIPTLGELTVAGVDDFDTCVATHRRLRQDAQDQLSTCATQLIAGGVKTVMKVREGDPATQIGRVARSGHAALIVMATHGRTGLARTLLGSVAGAVLRDVTLPVMLVRPTSLHGASPRTLPGYAAWTEGPPRDVVSTVTSRAIPG